MTTTKIVARIAVMNFANNFSPGGTMISIKSNLLTV